MGNIIDYIKWRGDIEIKYDGFNEVDNAILSRLSYFDFSNCFNTYKEELLLDEAYGEYSKLFPQEKNILWKDDDQLFPLMALSKRYQNLKLTRFVNRIDINEQKQFSVITIILPDNTIFISYRGTDNTIIGWKEDFNLSFQDNVPAQLESVKYLNEIAKAYPNIKIRLGGHSKGGNLAIYAATFCDDSIKKRILAVYNNDGPGVSKSISQKDNYKEMVNRMHTFIPQSSVVGKLLSHEEDYTVVESTQIGIMQHDIFSWQLEGTHFNYLDNVDNGSIIIDNTLKDWLNEMSEEERGKFIDTVFGLLTDTNIKTFSDMKKNWLESAKIVINNYKNVDQSTKENLNKSMKVLWNATKKNFNKKG